MNSKKGKKVHLEIILFFIVSIYCLLAPNRETCMDDTWISSIVGLSGSVKLSSEILSENVMLTVFLLLFGVAIGRGIETGIFLFSF